MHFDYALLGFVKQLAYLVYNASLSFLAPPSRTSIAANMGLMREETTKKFSKISICFVCLSFLAAAICTCIAIARHSWFWLLSCFNTIEVIMMVTMYFPQALFNFQRKRTSGFSIGTILTDFLGGVANFVQMVMQSVDQHSSENFFGNLGKTLLALVTILFNVVLVVQHYLVYPRAAAPNSSVVRSD